jgi:hypothetical protein
VRKARGLEPLLLHDELALNNDQAFSRQVSEGHFINCWQLFEGETLAMWGRYGKGVVIFSRYELLKSAMDIEQRWKAENDRVGVQRYHGAAVNARNGEFEGWPKDKQIQYSKNLLQILLDQGHLIHVVSVAMEASEYYRTVNEFGRKKLGSPYIACFKSCVSTLAQQMDLPSAGFAPEDKFAIILDRNEAEEDDAVRVFDKMKDDRSWPHSHRLATCAPGSWEDFTSLQCADLVAYESFRLVHNQHTASRIRKALELMFDKNAFLGYTYDREALLKLKQPLESAFFCVDNGFVVNFPLVTEAMDLRNRK